MGGTSGKRRVERRKPKGEAVEAWVWYDVTTKHAVVSNTRPRWSNDFQEYHSARRTWVCPDVLRTLTGLKEIPTEPIKVRVTMEVVT